LRIEGFGVDQCSNCGRSKGFHSKSGYFPLAIVKTKNGNVLVFDVGFPVVEDEFGRVRLGECPGFDNAYIQVMGVPGRFHSVEEARKAGALGRKP
jgi:hypothetical protein